MGHTNLPSSSSALVASALENVLSHEWAWYMLLVDSAFC